MKLKFCGLSTTEAIDAANRARPDYVGFVFAESRRRVTFGQAATLRERLNPAIHSVGVFLRGDTDAILRTSKAGMIDLVQLHGDWTNDEILSLREKTDRPVIRAIPIREKSDFALAEAASFCRGVDYLLLDGPTPGSGVAFDWRDLREWRFSKPFFLAGGITAENLRAAMAVKPAVIDLSGGIETDGQKDRQKMLNLAELFRETLNGRKER